MIVTSAGYQGDIRLGDTIDVKFSTSRFSSGASFTLAGTPAVAAYVGNNTTEITAGITLTVDFDSRTGMHNVNVVASGGNGFATATNVTLAITAGTVDGVSVVGVVVGSFSIENRPVNVVAINGGKTDGYNAILKLRKLDIQSQAGDGYAFNVVGGNASGATAASSAVNFTGGSASTTGGGVAGTGLNVVGGAGATSTNAARYAATFDAGDDNGAGGAVGIDIVGNATAALRILAVGTNMPGLKALGSAGGAGIQAIGGDAVTTTPAGAGIQSTGGTASTSSGGTAGAGIKATGGAGAASTNGAGDGAVFTGGGTTTVSGGSGFTCSGTGSLYGFNPGGGGAAIAPNVITAAVIADGAIDRATFAADTGLQTVRSGTCQSGSTATTIKLDAGASATNSFYTGDGVYLTGGTGAGLVGAIIGYDGSTKVATIAGSWITTPDNTTTFAVVKAVYGSNTIIFV